jgi:hypothetical protein
MVTWRRLLALSATGTVLAVAVVLAVQPPQPPVWTFRVLLGVNDQKPTDWSGKVEAVGGEVVAIEGWHFEEKDKVLGTSGWQCRTHDYVAFGQRAPVQLANGKPRTKQQKQPWPNGVIITIKGHAPTLKLKLGQGDVAVDASLIPIGQPLTILGGRVVVERMPETVAVRPAARLPTEGAVQDDYPAFWVHYKSGKQYLAWLAYHQGKDRVLLAERDGPDGPWSESREISGAGYHFRVALATTHGGKLWIVWSQMIDNNWDLYARPYQDGKLGETIRLTDDPGPDIWHRMTTDNNGRAWLVWQGFRKGRSHIFARCVEGDAWHQPIRVSSDGIDAGPLGNCWDPAIAADPTADRVWIGWDQYLKNTYQVHVTALEGGPNPRRMAIVRPEPSPLFQAHVSLAVDGEGLVWAAWDESGPQWGKDTGFLFGGQDRDDTSRLYSSRSIRIKVLDQPRSGKTDEGILLRTGRAWREPKADFLTSLPEFMREYNELPQLQPDSDGRMWLAFRHRSCRFPREDGWAAQGRWDLFATASCGDKWTPPTELPHSGGRLDMRTSSQRDGAGNVYFAFASDNRGWLPPAMLPRNHAVAVSRFHDAPPARRVELNAVLHGYQHFPECHPQEASQVARIRKHHIDAGGKTYHIYRGDLHRHTDLSGDGMGDGSIMDLHRYGLDAAALDFVMVTDHNMGQDNEYCWWQTQQANDLYTVPGAFISMYGYERSVPYPQGHRNVIWTRRGHRTLPLPKPIKKALQGDTARLYEYLRSTDGICTLHTSATSQGTDWEDTQDPALEPFVELFQGYHTSYEAPDAPKVINDKTYMIHGKYEPAGFVSAALAKGYKLGFQSSSDHISTHVSYACVLAEEFSRQGLVEAIKKRHAYAATDNIVLDVRCGSAIMGDEVRTARPRFSVAVLGTGPLATVEVLRDSAVVHTVRPTGKTTEEVRFDWEEAAPPTAAQASYYYIRVTQQNGQMAWSSPIWVNR